MHRLRPTLLSMIAAVIGLITLSAPAPGVPPIPSEVVQRLQEVVPRSGLRQPMRPRRVLVYSECRGYRHEAITHGNLAIQIMGMKSAAYRAEIVSTDTKFTTEGLIPYDAIVLNNTTGELFTEPAQREALVNFVKSGKGLVGIHAATDCCYKWPEYGRMIGAYFDGHPWHEEVTIRVEDPEHPLTSIFRRRTFQITDEIYQFKEPYSRKNLRILLSLAPAFNDLNKPGVNRDDRDFAVSWIRDYGTGRVFYTSLGHDKEVFFDQRFLRHLLAGIQYACGDITADATPSAKFTSPWRDLFDGKTLKNWDCKPGSWTAENGILTRKGGDYLWTKEKFGDFILDCEFKISPDGNSGIFFRVGDRDDPVQTGLELQILDSYGNATPNMHDCGAIYDCMKPAINAVRPAGQWNHVQLLCQDNRIRAALNGRPIIQMDLERWTVAGRNPDATKNKFKQPLNRFPRRGYIGFQDHGDDVWFRNIRIKPLGDK